MTVCLCTMEKSTEKSNPFFKDTAYNNYNVVLSNPFAEIMHRVRCNMQFCRACF